MRASICVYKGSAAWFLMAGAVNGPVGAFFCIIIAWTGTAFSDVVIDGVVVSRSRGAEQVVLVIWLLRHKTLLSDW